MATHKLALGASLLACSAASASWLSVHTWVALLALVASVAVAVLVVRLSGALRSAERAMLVAHAEAEDSLGVQRHAFGNKLQVILGLIQLGKLDRAQEYIKGIDLRTLTRRAEESEPNGQS